MEKNNSLTESARSILEMLKKQLNSVDDYIRTDICSPSLYVGTYKKYNEGSLFGAWLDLTMFSSYDEFIEVCHKLHADEENPELMFQDYENFPHAFYSEYVEESMFEKILDYIELDDSLQPAYEAYLDNIDCTASVEDFEGHYEGDFDSEEQYAEYIAHEIWPEIEKESWGIYFDYEAYARDLFLQEYDFEDGHVFRLWS